MKNVALFTTTLLLTIAALFTACQKAEPLTETPVEEFQPTLPEGRYIGISFAHSTYTGDCMPTFRNCIVISWKFQTAMDGNRPYLFTEKGTEMDESYGSYFPLTDDFVLNTAQPGSTSGPVTVKAGLYPISETADGRIVFLDQLTATGQNFNVAPLVNSGNPQDAIGNLHNLAMQAILTPANRKEMAALAGNEAALRSFVSGKTEAFLNGNGIKLQTGEAARIAKTPIAENYENHGAVIAKSKLTAADQLIVKNLIDQAEKLPVTSIKELDAFVKFMTDRETEIAKTAKLDDAKTVLSAISVLKYSRYYWYWQELSKGDAATAGKKPWWKADIEGLLTGGLGQAIGDSITAYFTR